MQNYNLKFKILMFAGLLSVLPFFVSANDAIADKKQEISKQLDDTINTCAALISKIQDLERRVAERVGILNKQGILTERVNNEIMARTKHVDDALGDANLIVENSLSKLADTVSSSTKPAIPLRNFKKEVGKVKSDLLEAHKFIMAIIDLIKRETSKIELRQDDGGAADDSATSSSGQND